MDKFNSIEEKIIFERLKNYSEREDIEKNPDDFQFFSEENYNTGTLNFEAYIKELSQFWHELDKYRETNYYRNIHSVRKRIGKQIVLAKRVVRRMLKWLIEPICLQQTFFNNATTRMSGRLIELQNNLNLRINELFKEINSDRADLNGMNERISKIENEFYNEEREALELKEREAIELKEREVLELKERLNSLEKIVDLSNKKMTQFQDIHEELQSLGLESLKRSGNKFARISHAQAGEDRIVSNLVFAMGVSPKNCSYLDIGANHAQELSNTYYFYEQGARGVLVEANPRLIPELKLYRSEDIIINKCISNKQQEEVEFFVLNGDGLSTTSRQSAEQCIEKNQDLRIDFIEKIKTVTANEVLEQYFVGAPIIMNIDIEGMEMEVLESIDFNKYRPNIIVLEMVEYEADLVIGEKNQEILNFMNSKDYIEYAFTGINSIFVDKYKLKGAH